MPTKPTKPITATEVMAQLQRLHDEGVINLDAPAKQLLPQFRVAMMRAKAAQKSRSTTAGTEATAKYCFVGDQGWFSHEEEEE